MNIGASTELPEVQQVHEEGPHGTVDKEIGTPHAQPRACLIRA